MKSDTFTLHPNIKPITYQSLNPFSMKRFLTLITFLTICTITISAQTDFTTHLTSKVNGQGTVTVQQDARIDSLVNGDFHYIAPEKKDKTEDKTPSIQRGKKIKARGYRIQVYWGGSLPADESKAKRAGSRVTTIFPELQAYTKFESPHWQCRVGDFTKRDEAESYLKKLKESKLATNAIIVNSEIYTYK